MERLDPAQLIHQLLFGAGGRGAALPGFRGWTGGACPTKAGAIPASASAPVCRPCVGGAAAADGGLGRIEARLIRDLSCGRVPTSASASPWGEAIDAAAKNPLAMEKLSAATVHDPCSTSSSWRNDPEFAWEYPNNDGLYS